VQSWRQIDPVTWVSKLRKKGQWSNGDPLTAQDFVYSWRRAVDPKTGPAIGSNHSACTGFLPLVECGNDVNDNKSCDKAADELIHQGSATANPVKRRALMTRAARMEMVDYPLVARLQRSTPRLVNRGSAAMTKRTTRTVSAASTST
jgi:ABC-type oligopeptide transport system substrate-binding subunit